MLVSIQIRKASVDDSSDSEYLCLATISLDDLPQFLPNCMTISLYARLVLCLFTLVKFHATLTTDKTYRNNGQELLVEWKTSRNEVL